MSIEQDPIGFRVPQIDPRPTPYHRWNILTGEFVLQDDAVAQALADRKRDIERERARRQEAPIAFGGALFDADAAARENIAGTLARLLRGDGLPAGWIGWRDAGNAMRWSADPTEVVQARLAELSASIENRKQALYVAAWGHKAALDAFAKAGNFDGLMLHNVAGRW